MISDNFKVFHGRKFISSDYAIYKNYLYRATHIKDNDVELVSEDKISLDIGFVKYVIEGNIPAGIPDIYIKKVNKTELDELFKIEYFAEYEGLSFQIVTINSLRKTVTIGTNNAEIADRYDFIHPDKYYFEKELPLNDVQVVEEKIDLPNDKGVVDFNYVN